MKDFVMKGLIRVENGEVVAAIGLCCDLQTGKIEKINSIEATQDEIEAIDDIFLLMVESEKKVPFITIEGKNEEEER